MQLIAGTVNALYTTSRPARRRAHLARGGDRHWRSGQRRRSSPLWRPRGKRCRSRRPKRWAAARTSTTRVLRWRRGLAIAAVFAAMALALLAAGADRGQPDRRVCSGAARHCRRGNGIARRGARRSIARPRACSAGASEGLLAGPQPGGVAVAHIRAGGGARDGDRDDGERRHHGRQLPRDRGGVARHAAARRPLRPAGCPVGRGRAPAARPRGPARSSPPSRESRRWIEFRAVELHYRGERATFGAGDFEIVRRYGRMRFFRPGSRCHSARCRSERAS